RGGAGGGPVPRRVRRRDANAAHGRSAGARHPDRPAGAAGPARQSPPPGGSVRAARRAAGARRDASRGTRLLLRPHCAGGGGGGHARVRRGGVWPRGRGDPRQGRGAGRARGQRVPLRPRRRRVDRRSDTGRAAGARARGGLGLRERTREVRSPAAVRGHQALGLRARAVGVRAQGVRQHQDGLGGVRVHVGTSGYNFPEWKGTFYPAKLPESQMLEYYAQRLATVEINYTFYRMPNAKTVAGWGAATPAAFTFVLKAPQRITHIARLRD